MSDEIFSVFDRGRVKQAKHCVQCGRVFVWRKKWGEDFVHVRCCSQRCKQSYKHA